MKKLLVTLVLVLLAGCASEPYYYHPYVQGNCVDQAIYLRQDMLAQGYEVEIVFGMVHRGGEEVGHAWVKYKDKETGEWKRLKTN